jgi:hypothetical protein
MLKVYPSEGPSFISTTKSATGLNAWLVRTERSEMTRRFFPGMAYRDMHPFVAATECVDPIVPAPKGFTKIEHLSIFPFHHCANLLVDPPEDKPDNGNLDVIAKATLPKADAGGTSLINFRSATALNGMDTRVLIVYTKPPSLEEDTTNRSLFGKNQNKIKDFFTGKGMFEHAYIFSTEQKSTFRSCCLEGDTLSVTVLNETGKSDTLITASQFKRTEHGVWLNYIAVSDKQAKQNVYGAKGGFLTENTFFRNNGLGFTMLRTIQLMSCNYGNIPSLFIQVKLATNLAVYLRKIGFRIVKVPGLPVEVDSLAEESAGFARFQDTCHPEASPGFV